MLGWILFTIVWTLVVFVVSATIGIYLFVAMIAERDEKLSKEILEFCEEVKENKYD